MKTFTALATLAALAQAVVGQQLTINTPPNAVLCEPLQFSWTGGTAPYFLSLIPAGQPSAPAIKQFPQQSGNSFTWLVDLQANTNFNIALKDSTGQPAFSALITINSGTNSSCINTAVQEDGATSGGSAPTSGGAGATTPAGSSGSAAPATSASSGAKPSGSSSGASPSGSSASNSKSNAATHSSANSAFGIAVVMGLVGAALF